MKYRDFELIGENLYKADGRYWRVFAIGITPNNCWLIAPKMVELIDIVIESGKEIFGEEVIFDVAGTVPASYSYIRYAKPC